ncbi:hypothetical protein H1R17_07345 [Flavobacterium sp. xlx-214]|uniref:hypothetical protein n=1 Tax=unclassified Flavobacterium TaxID=196869 RepID=UPI0013D257DB|nr:MULTISPECIES: hypothetical protein [unclassified Flavobacterium]MBA5792526.1 hypothetical protein [Flavobacterium sp. xlx-221]QMI82322.1 hypothetical protein H1R17_07345 [Flavobacterium sp. xlx-214]
MKYLITFFVIPIFLVSCNKNREGSTFESGSNATPSTIENLNIQTKEFFEIDSTGVLMFPLEMGENKNEEGNFTYKEMPYNGYWNVLFLNSNTNEYNLLTESKVLILDYNYKYGSEEGLNISKKTNHIFYSVRTLDYNKDKLLNQVDPIYLFVSDKFGKNFRQLSPSNYSVHSWKYIQANNKIILTAYKDSNKNNAFDEKDEIATFEVILDQNEKPKEVFSSNLKDKLKTLYDKDWKRIKE